MFFLQQFQITPQELMDRLDRARAAIGLPADEFSVLVEEVLGDADEDTDFTIRPLPDEPTAMLPGTKERVKVMQERAAAGRSIWHPEDAVGADDGDIHAEQTGIKRPNGSQRRELCQEAMRNGASIVLSADPLEAVETLQLHFKDDGLRKIVEAIWRERGVRASGRECQPAPAEAPKRRRRRKQTENSGRWRQLTLWAEPAEAA